MIENYIHTCTVCGKDITSKSAYCLVHAIQSHCRKEGIKWREQNINEGYLREFKKILSDRNKNNSKTVEYINNRNANLLKKVGNEVYDNLPKCAICGMVSNQLYSHIVRNHGIKIDEYLKQYGGPIASESYIEGLRNRCIGENNPMYGKGVSENSPFSLEFYLNKGYSLEESEKNESR